MFCIRRRGRRCRRRPRPRRHRVRPSVMPRVILNSPKVENRSSASANDMRRCRPEVHSNMMESLVVTKSGKSSPTVVEKPGFASFFFSYYDQTTSLQLCFHITHAISLPPKNLFFDLSVSVCPRSIKPPPLCTNN